MNKKGFTLVELLAVIVILLAISVVAIPSISAGIERTKKKTDLDKIKVLSSYAEIYFSEHTETCVSIQTLKTTFNLTEEEVTGDYFDIKSGSIKNDYTAYKNASCSGEKISE